MNLKDHAKDAAQAVTDRLRLTLTEEQTEEVARLIEKTIIHAVVDEHKKCATVAKECCSGDPALASEIDRKIDSKTQVLIANLSAMR